MIATLLVIISCIGICLGKIKIPLKETKYIKIDEFQKNLSIIMKKPKGFFIPWWDFLVMISI